MSILTIKNEYAVTITYKCNWNCLYYAIKNKYVYKENLLHIDVMKKLDKIPNDSNVTIFGGEPILVDLDNGEIFAGGIHCSTLDLVREDEYDWYA